MWRVRHPDGVTRVHRPTGAWTPAVHALLAHLEARGLDGIPEVIGRDDKNQEVVSYLPGLTLDPETQQPSIDALVHAASWLRRFHDAVQDFRPGAVEWRQGLQDLAADEVICHNDPGLYNWVIVDNDFAGMIDWDRAGPGRPIDDLAFLCWSGVPLLREIPAEEAAARLSAVARAYGGVKPTTLLDAVLDRMDLIAQRWRAGLERGDPGTIALRDAGIMDRHLAKVQHFADRRAPILEVLSA